MKVNELLEATVSTVGWKTVKIPSDIDHKAIGEQIEEMFMSVFNPAAGYAIEKVKEPYCYAAPADDKKDSGKVALSYEVKVSKTVSLSDGGHMGYITYNLTLNVRAAFKDGEIYAVDVFARSYEKRSGFSSHDKSYDLGAHSKKSINQLMQVLKSIKASFDVPILKVEAEMKDIKSKPLNQLRELKPSKVIEDGKEQLAAVRQFGARAKKLVDKYAEFNRENTTTHHGYYGAAELRTGRSGSIQFKYEHTHNGGQYGITKTAWVAILIGTNYPPDKADAFAKDLMKLISSTLPTEIPVLQKDGTTKAKKVALQTDLGGTNYKTFMVLV